EHSVAIVGLVPPLLYFIVILVKQSLTWVDALVLCALYLAYLWVLLRNPAHQMDQLEYAPAVSRWAVRQRGWRRTAAIGGLFAAGGGLLYARAHPLLESILARARVRGVPQVVLVQRGAPCRSDSTGR